MRQCARAVPGPCARAENVGMEFSELRPRFARALAGFTAESEGSHGLTQIRLDRERFPVPEMLLILLRDVMGFRSYGVGEKVRWTVCFGVGGKPYAVELAKFGLRLYYPEGQHESLARVMGQLEAALGKLEKSLETYAKERVRSGDVTIANRSRLFQGRYQFFRDRAQAAYRAADRPPRRRKKAAGTVEGLGAELFEAIGAKMNKQGEGFYYSVAMIDAYFSYLEHQLVLLRAFMGTALSETTVVDLLGMRWDEKLSVVLGVDAAIHKDLVGGMRKLKERIRNPFAHGGVENDGGSMYFHVPNVGALPANMSRTRSSAHFNFLPVDSPDHAKACELFDGLDQVLRNGRLEWPSQMIEAGVDPAWDRASMAQYRKLNHQSSATREAWLERWAHEWEMHQNMDY